MSPTHLKGAKRSKKRKFILNTDEDEEANSQDDIAPLFEKKKTRLSIIENEA